MRRVITTGCIALLVTLAPAQPARALTAKEALQLAEIAYAEKRYREAAEHMEEVYRLTSDPQWLARAGFARMMAGQLDTAIADLSQALAGSTLPEEQRARAEDRHARALEARDHLASAEEAKARGELEAAAKGYDLAYGSVPIGAYLLEAASSWERSGHLLAAESRYRRAATLGDLTEAQRKEVAESLPRVATAIVREKAAGPPDTARNPYAAAIDDYPQPAPLAPEPIPELEPESSTPALGWVLVGTGVASIGLGIAGFVMSEGERSDWKAHRDTLSDAQAIAMNDRAETWWNVGLVAGGVGLAVAVSGVVLVATHDEGERDTLGTVRVGALPASGGAVLTALGHF